MKVEIEAFKRGVRVTENGTTIGVKGAVLKCKQTRDGYKYLCLRINGKLKGIMIHRLVAFQKFGEDMYKDKIEVRHSNGDSSDNSWGNILIGTHSQNMMDIPEQIRMKKALHATSFVRKYDKDSIRKFYIDSGRSYKKTMQEFDIASKGTLHFVLNGRTKKQ